MNQRSLQSAAVLFVSALAFPAYSAAQSDAGVEAPPPASEVTELPPAPAEPPEATVEATPTSPVEPAPQLAVVVPTPSTELAPPVAPTAPAAPPTPPPPSTPTPSATGTPSAAPVTAVVAGVAIRITGIAHTSIYASQGVQSLGNATTVAPTSALNPILLGNQANDAQLSFQVQQSRFGLTLGEGSPFRAVFEIDFVHFDQSSPTAQAFPRIRIAQLEWHFDANNRLFVGQGWDIFGNAIGPQLLSHSSNLVGTMFQAGNIGFMRHQLGWEGRFGDVAVALAVGLQGSNFGPTFNNLEESATPTGSARVMYYVNPTSVVGVSGIGTAERFTNPAGTADERRLALAGELFADMTLGPVVIHAEAYIAQNLANTGALNLGQGRYQHDVADAGGYLSGRLNLGEWSITAMYGFAGVLRPSEVVAGYTSANAQWNAALTAGQTPTMLAATGLTNGTPGMAWNMSGHVGVWYSPMRGLSFVLEPYFYYTRFVMDATPQHDPSDPSHMLTLAGSTTDAQVFGAQIERFAAGGQFVSMFQF